MYADRVEAETGRSIKERLNGTSHKHIGRNRTDNPVLPNRTPNLKRQRQVDDDKWKHDLFDGDSEPPTSKLKVAASKDLRFKLQKKGLLPMRSRPPNAKAVAMSGKPVKRSVLDLCEKLSGTALNTDLTEAKPVRAPNTDYPKAKLKQTPSTDLVKAKPVQVLNSDLPKAKAGSESAKLVKKSVPSVKVRVPGNKKITKPISEEKSEHKSELTLDGLLQSLGLEKYSLMFQAEEVDMTALMHLTAEELKSLGLPMGPRKKILSALESSPYNGG